MEAIYLLLGKLVFWLTVTLAVLVVGAIAFLALVLGWYTARDWLIARGRNLRPRRPSSALLPPSCDPAQADTAKLPAIQTPPEPHA
jgi:hypothetical protein